MLPKYVAGCAGYLFFIGVQEVKGSEALGSGRTVTSA